MLVNATSQGMIGQAALDLRLDKLPKAALVNDIIYIPRETPLIAAARARGNRTVTGLGMLLHQGIPAWKAWFGIEPKVTAELRAQDRGDAVAISCRRLVSGELTRSSRAAEWRRERRALRSVWTRLSVRLRLPSRDLELAMLGARPFAAFAALPRSCDASWRVPGSACAVFAGLRSGFGAACERLRASAVRSAASVLPIRPSRARDLRRACASGLASASVDCRACAGLSRGRRGGRGQLDHQLGDAHDLGLLAHRLLDLGARRLRRHQRHLGIACDVSAPSSPRPAGR